MCTAREDSSHRPRRPDSFRWVSSKLTLDTAPYWLTPTKNVIDGFSIYLGTTILVDRTLRYLLPLLFTLQLCVEEDLRAP